MKSKKHMFTVMNYLLPKRMYLLHCSATLNQLVNPLMLDYGYGKYPNAHQIVGDDEHAWITGILNLEMLKCASYSL